MDLISYLKYHTKKNIEIFQFQLAYLFLTSLQLPKKEEGKYRVVLVSLWIWTIDARDSHGST